MHTARMHTAHMHTADATCTYTKAHRQMFTLRDVVCAVSSEVVAEGLESVDSMTVDNLGLETAAGWGGAVVTTEALAMAA